MTLIKMGSLAVAASGKMSGIVFTRNRAGAAVRSWAKPINPQSTFQQTARSLTAAFAQNWRGLTESQRLGWNALANTGLTYRNRLGEPFRPSGINIYVQFNINLFLSGNATITAAPNPLPSVLGMVMQDLTITVGGASALALAGQVLAPATPTVPAGTTLLVFASAPLSPGKTYIKSQMRLIGTVAAAGDTSTNNLWADYIARFGTPGVGGKIKFHYTPINNASGQAGIPSSQENLAAV